jgi:pilus assembly protein CpaB
MRDKQVIISLVLALILGVGAAFSARSWLKQQIPAAISAEAVETQTVVTVQTNVGVGTILTKAQLKVVDWPKAYLPEGAYFNIQEVEGRVVKMPLTKGDPIRETNLLPKGSQGGLVAVIDKSMRAVSVKVDAVIGVAGFVTPGSHVDVLATLRRIDQKNKLPYSMVILQDVRVLAIDQKLEEAEKGEAHLVSVVTLEVTPKQAEHLTYAAHEGRLQLAMRNPGDRETVTTRSTGVSDLLPSRYRSRAAATGSPIQLIKGSHLSSRNY